MDKQLHHIYYVYYENTYRFPNLKSASSEVWESPYLRIQNSITVMLGKMIYVIAIFSEAPHPLQKKSGHIALALWCENRRTFGRLVKQCSTNNGTWASNVLAIFISS